MTARKENIKFHIKENDYFGTLATVIDLIRQSAEEKGFTEANSKTIANLVEDLMFLQKNYKISKK